MSLDLLGAPDLLDTLVRANLVGGLAILAVLAARKALRPVLGAQLAYGLWLVPIVLAAASIVPLAGEGWGPPRRSPSPRRRHGRSRPRRSSPAARGRS